MCANEVFLGFESGKLSDPGCVRQNNEDSVLLEPAGSGVMGDLGLLAVVADGMGGHQAGEVASRLAVLTIQQVFADSRQMPPPAALGKAFEVANRTIYEEGAQNPAFQGMGTTATALVLRRNTAFFAHVGDSRLYRLRHNVLEQLSEDHTLVMTLLRDGLLTEEEARNHPDRHVLVRVMGTHPSLQAIDTNTGLPVEAGDVFLLCSDGLHDLVTPEEILESLDGLVPDAANAKLVELAKSRGGHDNISVIVVKASAPSCPLKTIPITRDNLVAANA